MGKIKMGIIGCGSIAKYRHIPEAISNENVELVSLCDACEERALELSERFGVKKIYTDYSEMLVKENLDAVVVCTPNFLHADATIKAFENGCHVLCEKPMATSLSECENMIKAAKESKKFLMIGQNQRFNKAHIKAKEIIENCELGKVLTFKTTFGHGGPENWSVEDGYTWFFEANKAVFGSMGDLGVHKIDLLRFILGEEFIEVSAFITTLAKKYKDSDRLINVDDNAVCLLKTQSGAIGTLTASWTYAGSEDNSTTIYCEKGSMVLYGHPEYSLIVNYADGQKVFYKLDVMQTNQKQTKSGVMDAFVDCIINNIPPSIDGHEGYKTMKVVFACFESAKEGRNIRISY